MHSFVYQTSKPTCCWLLAMAVVCGMLSNVAIAQKPAAEASAAETDPDVIVYSAEIIKLKYADPELVKIIMQSALLGTIRTTASPQDGALIVTGTPEAITKAKAFVQKFDAQAQAMGIVAKASKPPMTIRILPLKYSEADDVVEILKGAVVGENVRFLADNRTNAVIAHASAEQLTAANELVEALDQAAGSHQQQREHEQEQMTWIFRLKHVAVDKDFENILQMQQEVLGMHIALDAARNRIIASGTNKSMQQLEALLKELDVKPKDETTAAQAQRQLRFIWLVSGADVELPEPPADLKDVMAELDKIGVSKLRLAAQTVVKSIGDDPFSVECTSLPDGQTELSLRGRRVGDEALQLTVRATGTSGGGGLGGGGAARTLCSIETTVKTPDGHYVVLGVAPTGELTSVFVVQVTKPSTGESK